MALPLDRLIRGRPPVSVAWLCAGLLCAFVAAEPAQAEARWWSGLAGAGIAGSGRMVEQPRQVAAFSAVRGEGAVLLQVTQGASQAVRVRADDNLIEHLQTVVEERDGRPTLVVRWKSGLRLSGNTPPQVRVQVPDLRHLSSHGSGDVEFDAFKTDTLVIAMHGSGDVRAPKLQAEDLQVKLFGSSVARLGGQVGRLEVLIAGSGDVKAEPLQAGHVKVSIRGSGNARVTADKSLAVNIAGSGDVSYAGNATAVTSAVAGSGHLRKL